MQHTQVSQKNLNGSRPTEVGFIITTKRSLDSWEQEVVAEGPVWITLSSEGWPVGWEKRFLGFPEICLLNLSRTKENTWKGSYWGSAVTRPRLLKNKGKNWEASECWSCIWGIDLFGFIHSFLLLLVSGNIYKWLYLQKGWIYFKSGEMWARSRSVTTESISGL